jgi:hypothetical protein
VTYGLINYGKRQDNYKAFIIEFVVSSIYGAKLDQAAKL